MNALPGRTFGICSCLYHLIPDTAHGTNPASGALCGFDTVTLRSNAEGGVDLEHLESLMTEDVAALMLTNPNTCGLLERDIVEIAAAVHAAGIFEIGYLHFLDMAGDAADRGIRRQERQDG